MYDDINFETLFGWRYALISILEHIPVDQWVDVLGPLMDLRDVTYVMFSESFQPFYLVFWSSQMLLLSCRRDDELPYSAGMRYHRHLRSDRLIPSCYHLDSKRFPDYADQTFILKQLMEECIRTAFSITANYYYPYVFLINHF